MKTILHISKYYYPYIGGVEVTAQYLAEGMYDFNNIVLCFNSQRGNREETVNGVRIYRAGSLFKLAKQSISFSYYFLLKKIFKKYRPDFVHVHCPNPFIYPLLLLTSNDFKLVLHWHLDIVNQKRIYPFIKWIERKLLQRADLILVTSPNYKEFSRPLFPFKDKVHVLQSAIIPQKFILQSSDLTRIDSIKQIYKNKKIIFFVGRHVEYKGLKYLIKAEKYIRNDCHIVIAGEGPLTAELMHESNSDRISFIGRITDNELKHYLYASDIFAFPSITKNEAFGLALAEAMYCKCVPVTFYIEGSGVNWVSLNKITGIEVPCICERKYAEALDVLLENEDLRVQYGIAAHKRVIDMFTIDKEIHLVLELYKELEA